MMKGTEQCEHSSHSAHRHARGLIILSLGPLEMSTPGWEEAKYANGLRTRNHRKPYEIKILSCIKYEFRGGKNQKKRFQESL
jgi:hypothetical protein